MNQTNWKKNTALFLSSQTISLFGSALVQYAIIWYITLTTKSGSMQTIAVLCGFAPMFAVGIFAGVWADRYNRKTIIALADSMIAIATLALAVLFMLGYQELWLLFVMLAIRGLGGGIQMPAVVAFIPQITPTEKLTRINGLYGTVQALTTLVAPIVAGALLSLVPLQYIFFIDMGTAAIAVCILLFALKVPAHAKALAKQTISYFADMAKGFRYIRGHKYLLLYFLFCTFFFFLAAPAAFLTPLQVARTFGADVWRLTAIEVTFSAGMAAGGFLMSAWKGFKNKIHTMTLSAIIFGVCTVALGLVPNFWVYLGFMVLCGFGMPLFGTPSTVMLQERVEGDFMGRVFSVQGMITTIMMPMGMVLFGPLADVIRIEWMLIATGALMLVAGGFLYWNKTLLEAGKPRPKIEQTADVNSSLPPRQEPNALD